MLIALGCMLLSAASTAGAQGAPLRLIIEGCDASHAPDITCAFAPVDPTSRVLESLDGVVIRVRDGGVNASDLAVLPLRDPAVRAHAVVFGAAGDATRLAFATVLDSLDPNDQVAFERADAAQPLLFVPVAELRGRALPVVPRQSAVGRLADCDGIGELARLRGVRLIVLLIDPRPRRNICDPDGLAAQAQQAGVSLVMITPGARAPAASISRAARLTGGMAIAAAQARSTFKPWLQAQRNRYLVRFIAGAPDGAWRDVDISAQTAGTAVVGHSGYQALPSVPYVRGVNVSAGTLTALPSGARVFITPTLVAQSVSRVEFTLAGRTVVVDSRPVRL